jgi:hypothetical protein
MYRLELQTDDDSGSAALFEFLDAQLDDFLDFHDLLLVYEATEFRIAR